MLLPKVYRVACHTDHVGPGTVFVAIPGSTSNGASYLESALDLGAQEIVIEQSTDLGQALADRCVRENIKITRVDNARQALAQLSSQAYANPADKLKFIGVTGTKGKTTSVYLMRHILREAGYRVAMITGVENYIGDDHFHADLTTPQPDFLHMFFNACVQQNIEYVVMEASAQAFSLHRLDGINFDGIIFTNFSLEHSEFYSSLDDYFQAKCQIFDHCKRSTVRIVNANDMRLSTLSKNYQRVIDVGYGPEYTYRAQLQKADMTGIVMNIWKQKECTNLRTTQIVGPYNAENILGVFACAVEFGIDSAVVKSAIEKFSHVPGRLERFNLANGVQVVVDYAHNPSSFQALFSMLRQNTGELWVIFGCGGGRDKTKRPIMGELAARYGDMIVLTTDNPRNEKAEDIVNDILLGISQDKRKSVIVEMDRSKAIARAVQNARPGSIIAIVGKGPDEYQQFGQVKTFFSDRQEVLKFV